MSEFTRKAECPCCGLKTWVNIEFNFDDSDEFGCDASPTADCCNECENQFNVKGYLSFEIDVEIETMEKEEK